MSVESAWAKSAVRMALRPSTSRVDAIHMLRRAAHLHPDAIKDEIASLQAKIHLLEDYLPEEPNHER